jgi:hypothetical protein
MGGEAPCLGFESGHVRGALIGRWSL